MQIQSIYDAERDIDYLLQTICVIMSFVIAAASRRLCFSNIKVSIFIILLLFLYLLSSLLLVAKVQKRFWFLLVSIDFFVNFAKEIKKT